MANPERHTSGLTTRLILSYVERAGGALAVREVLALAGLSELEHELREENSWFDYETKIRLFKAAAVVLEDPEVARHIGEAALELNIGVALKGVLRAFGSPRMLYAGVGRASARFTWAHRWETVSVGSRNARLRYHDVSGVGYRAEDCAYNQGLLACAPELFGLPPAEIRHVHCAVDGAPDGCFYEVAWQDHGLSAREMLAGAVAVVAAAIAALTIPAGAVAVLGLLPVLAVIAGFLRSNASLRRHARALQRELHDQREISERLQTSVSDMVSNVDTEDVLDRVIHSAEEAIGGSEFALLLRDDEGVLRCERASELSPSSKSALESWAMHEPRLLSETLTIDSTVQAGALAVIALDTSSPFGSLIAAPLAVRDEQFGVLFALARGDEIFLPEDVRLLQTYASQAAIALANARLVARLGRLAREDPLTGLLNHRELHEALESELDRSHRYERPLSLASFDLDHFKLVNDTQGHAAGDRVLRTVADEIRHAARRTDSAFRVGGDEFALLLPETDAAAATAVAERIAAHVEAAEVGVTISFGVAEWPTDGIAKDDLLVAADLAMYASKRLGRDGEGLELVADDPVDAHPVATGPVRVSRNQR